MVTESPKAVTSGAGDAMSGSKVSITVDVLLEVNQRHAIYLLFNLRDSEINFISSER